MLTTLPVHNDRMEELLQRLDILMDENSTEETIRETIGDMGKQHSYVRYLVADIHEKQEKMEALKDVGEGHLSTLGHIMYHRRHQRCWFTSEHRELYGCDYEGVDEDEIEDNIHYDDEFIELTHAPEPHNNCWEPEHTRDGEYYFLLSTGGPACRLVIKVQDERVRDARLEVQDWFTPWTRKDLDADKNEMLREIAEDMYCRYLDY